LEREGVFLTPVQFVATQIFVSIYLLYRLHPIQGTEGKMALSVDTCYHPLPHHVWCRIN